MNFKIKINKKLVESITREIVAEAKVKKAEKKAEKEELKEEIVSENTIQDILNLVTNPEYLPAIIASLGLGTAAVATAKQALKDPEKFKQDLKTNMQSPKGVGPKGGM